MKASKKTLRIQNLIVIALVCGLTFTSTSLFAQSTARVPIGPPTSALSHSPLVPRGPLPQVLPQVPQGGGVQIGQSYDGIDFNGSNCFCLPPDTNAAVGDNYVVEAVNVQMRVFDKSTGAVLLDEPLSTLFGAPTGGDPYVTYDDIADRWYINAFDSSDSGLFLAVSKTNDPRGSWYVYDLTAVGGFPDFAKPGFNKDAIFISYNDFGSNGGYAAIAAIDKAQALAGSLVYYTSYPPPQFRAIPPAKMHGDDTGGVEWFVSIWDFGGNTVRVTKMTNYLSNSPRYKTWELPVQPFGQIVNADQPGAPGSVVDNDPTATQVQYHKGRLVTATWASTAADGFVYPKGHYYQIDVNGNGVVKPRLMNQGVIDPGPGVAVWMASVDEDIQGNLGFTWMESSLSEYVSMWTGNLYTNGNFSAQDVAPGGGFMPYSFRTGDYSSTVLDPDGRTFWTANEYIGSNGYLGPGGDIWLTHITSFRAR